MFTEYGGAPHPQPLTDRSMKQTVQTFHIDTKERITAIGISVQIPARAFASVSSLALLDIFEITLKPTKEAYVKTEIREVKLLQHCAGKWTAHYRLAWTVPNTVSASTTSSSATPSSTHLPWSNLTGPFSHFTIVADKKGLGQAYATEFIIDPYLYEDWKRERKQKVSFEVFGYAFDGTRIGYAIADIPFPDLKTV